MPDATENIETVVYMSVGVLVKKKKDSERCVCVIEIVGSIQDQEKDNLAEIELSLGEIFDERVPERIAQKLQELKDELALKHIVAHHSGRAA